MIRTSPIARTGTLKPARLQCRPLPLMSEKEIGGTQAASNEAQVLCKPVPIEHGLSERVAQAIAVIGQVNQPSSHIFFGTGIVRLARLGHCQLQRFDHLVMVTNSLHKASRGREGRHKAPPQRVRLNPPKLWSECCINWEWIFRHRENISNGSSSLLMANYVANTRAGKHQRRDELCSNALQNSTQLRSFLRSGRRFLLCVVLSLPLVLLEGYPYSHEYRVDGPNGLKPSRPLSVTQTTCAADEISGCTYSERSHQNKSRGGHCLTSKYCHLGILA